MDDAPVDEGLQGERTTLAWQRSGLSMAVVGGLIGRAVGEADGLAVAIVAAGAVVIAGGCAWAHGERSYRRDRTALAVGRIAPHVGAVRSMAAVTTLIAALALALALVIDA